MKDASAAGAAAVRDTIIRVGYWFPAVPGDGWSRDVLISGTPTMNDIKKRLEDEMKTLDYELKVELPKEILRAREYGDLRENAEYKAAKERQTYLQVRISQLQQRIAALSMMNIDRIPRDKVGLGSTVTLKDTSSGATLVYDIVTPEEADPTKGRISPSSPIGKCLLGAEEGDVVEVKVPSGEKEYEVLKLITIHDQVSSEPASAD
jgi:transcription elongation factor GreA